jgi:hypothetical protein
MVEPIINWFTLLQQTMYEALLCVPPNLRLTKFLVNNIHIYGSKLIYGLVTAIISCRYVIIILSGEG